MRHKELAENFIASCMEYISNEELKSLNFGYGLTGICWTYQLLHNHQIIENPTDLLENVDDLVAELMMDDLKKNHFDLHYGGLGGILYFLERLVYKDVKHHLRLALLQLKENATCSTGFAAWSNERFKITSDSGSTEYNFGLAHGIPSILTVVSLIYSAAIEKDTCYWLMDNSIEWLKNEMYTEKNVSLFPKVIRQKKTVETFPSVRIGWCYGDLGIAYSIWMAGNVTKNEAWQQYGLSIAKATCTKQDLAMIDVVDASFCHGTSGIAHMYSNLFKATGIHEFEKASLYWYGETIRMAKYEDGLAGFKTFQGEGNGFENEPGLLEGITGISLSLLGAFYTTTVNWDRCFLLS